MNLWKSVEVFGACGLDLRTNFRSREDRFRDDDYCGGDLDDYCDDDLLQHTFDSGLRQVLPQTWIGSLLLPPHPVRKKNMQNY